MLRPHGRLISISGISHSTPDDMSSVVERLDDRLRPERRDQAMAVAKAGVNAGFVVAYQGTAPTTGSTSPNTLADSIAARHFSHLWDLTASKWERFVEPAIDELRSLPNPDQIRQRTFQHPLVVLAKQ